MNQPHPHVCPTTLMSSPTIAILGLGLMGASFAAALREAEAAGHVIGYDLNPDHAAYCQQQKFVHAVALSPADAVEAADIVVLAAPISALDELARSIAPALREGTVVTDLSSVKARVTENIAPLLPKSVHFVPAHPIAGKSEHGPQAADASLFSDCLTVLCPIKGQTPDYAISAITRLWQMVGARTERMAPSNHDIIYAYVSHLPQMMAYAACSALADSSLPVELPESFRRFIRLGGSDPFIWQEIALANSEMLGHALEHVLATAEHMRGEFAQGTAEGHESKPSPQAATRFFPMLACASLVSALTQFEIQNEIRLAPYAGSGLADFTAPANENPEDALAEISESYVQVDLLLARFCEALTAIHQSVENADSAALLARLQAGHSAFGNLRSQVLAS